MNELLSQLFGAGDLRLGVDGVRLGLAHPLAPWIWALIVIGAGGVSAWSYWRLEGRRSARIALAALRATLLLLIALMLAGPRLVKPNETVEKDWVVVLADRSGSMRVADVDAGGNAGGTRITRDRQMRDALRDAYPALSKVAAERELLFLGFDGAAYPIKVERDAQGLMPLNLPEASGTRTSIATALSQAMARTAARPVSGFVLLSDGRTSEPPDKALLRRLQADGIPIFALPLGSPSPVGDLAITRVESPSAAFVRDTVPVQVRIERRGTTSPDSTAVVELVDDTTGRVLESRPLAEGAIDPLDESVVSLTLSGSETDAGARSWTVRLKTAAADLITENNERSIQLDMIDRPIRTVYFDGYPRWEFRYVKNLLIREGSIRLLEPAARRREAIPPGRRRASPLTSPLIRGMGAVRRRRPGRPPPRALHLRTAPADSKSTSRCAAPGFSGSRAPAQRPAPGARRRSPSSSPSPWAAPRTDRIIAQRPRVWDRPVVVKPTPRPPNASASSISPRTHAAGPRSSPAPTPAGPFSDGRSASSPPPSSPAPRCSPSP
jgi:hypothetical protein